ncbi:unnamed protein product [Parajaminaea phylloscopi]
MSLGHEPLVDTQVDPAIAEAAARLAAGTPLIATPASENAPLRTGYIQGDVVDQHSQQQSNGAASAVPSDVPVGAVATSSPAVRSSNGQPETTVPAAAAASGPVFEALNATPKGLPSDKSVDVAPQGLEGPAKDIINKLANGGGVAPGPGKVRLTSYPAIANALLPVEGSGQFSNLHLALLVWFTPAVLLRVIPFIKASWIPWWLYFVLCALTGLPVTVAYWSVMSRIGARKNEKVTPPGKPIEHYLQIKDPELRKKYHGNNKIPMDVFSEAYFAGKIDIVGGDAKMLEVLEHRMDWAAMVFTPELFKYVLTTLVPDVLSHSARQDEEQVRDHYDRGNDFYEWFLGPQMIYTSGVISDPTRKETLEELQDNKLALVCSKLNLQPTDKLLDIGCGWGTLTAFAAKNFGCDATGVTLAREQTKFGNDRIARNGIDSSKARILCMDYRDIPVKAGHYDKIVSLEMAEHVGIRHYSRFLRDVYERLSDDGVFLFQVAGLRPQWQFWDLIWGLFMNKHIFRGADASLHVGWVITQLEKVGFEVRSCDVLGVHYSATIHRWLEMWFSNEEKVKAKYGEKLWRIWVYFLASSTIIAREGGSSVFQIALHKNLNATHRIESVFSHGNIHPKPRRDFVSVYK